MSLNKTFDGFVSEENGTLANGTVSYQGFFYKVNGSSSPSTWNNVRTVETGGSAGYYNINLGDADWLSQTGTAAAGDIIVIVFWKGGSDRTANCSILQEWGAFEITMTSADTYTNPTQVKSNIIPNLIWTLTANGWVGVSYGTTNSSNDIHNWTWSSTTMYHWYTRYGQTIFSINKVNNSDYYWGDTSSTLDIPGAGTASHTWTAAGIYDVDIVIEDECGATVTGTKQIQIKWKAPTADITMTPAVPDPNEVVTFEWTGTDVDNTITTIDWVIHDSGGYGSTDTTTTGLAKSATVPHTDGIGTDWCSQSGNSGAFTNPGVHNVEIVIHYYDGFSMQTINYDEDFNQGIFTGPTVSFDQVPAQATVTSGVKFVNTSTNTSRVGLGLPDCAEYDWTWTDDGVTTDYLDKTYSYELQHIPTSPNCQVKLCANWSDGWDTQQTCVEEDVVFATTVTVTPVDCYYDLYVVGTSSDGSVTGYNWTIASGISQTGPWSTIWTTPTGVEQQDKTICFTDVGWYNITGYVHGTGATTSDNEILYIDEVCPETVVSGVCTNIIWNGTGVLDEGGDWGHSKSGTETAGSMHTGTNGLDATGLKKNDKIWFSNQHGDNISEYDMLIVWANMRSWASGKEMNLKFHSLGSPGGWSDAVSLGDYIDMSMFNTWQRAIIPLSRFDLINYNRVDTLEFESNGSMGLYLDDIALTVGTTVPIAGYDMYGTEVGGRKLTAKPLEPSVKPDEFPGTPSKKAVDIDLRPSMKGRGAETSPVLYPKPINL